MSPLESRYPITEGLEYLNIAEAQEKNTKTPFVNVREFLHTEEIKYLKNSRKAQIV